jgi:hypothetical protein
MWLWPCSFANSNVELVFAYLTFTALLCIGQSDFRLRWSQRILIYRGEALRVSPKQPRNAPHVLRYLYKASTYDFRLQRTKLCPLFCFKSMNSEQRKVILARNVFQNRNKISILFSKFCINSYFSSSTRQYTPLLITRQANFSSAMLVVSRVQIHQTGTPGGRGARENQHWSIRRDPHYHLNSRLAIFLKAKQDNTSKNTHSLRSYSPSDQNKSE